MSFRRLIGSYRGRYMFLPYWALAGKAHAGYCPICEGRTVFVMYDSWLRDNYRCVRCWSIPRQRAIIKFLSEAVGDWSTIRIHESSPGGVASDFIARRAVDYTATQYYPEISPGEYKNGFRCENLEGLTFGDNSFDLVVTQDVLEHVLNPAKAVAEIARTLKPGGMHVFTVPLYQRPQTLIRARRGSEGEIEYLERPEYHDNPIDEEGSLVAREWGRDIAGFIERHCGLSTEIKAFDDRQYGLVAEFLDVLVTRKPH